ncbi:bifunctional adenosylcobinamide kinase/adenosylcobinamide-phosphate guanylyltransferase [Bacillus benzoevorans]|uniref:Adenosylcobinamide kinase n=1 Tax=Bacillus benzoevorans TaxID=1456 RepID=A0A7X0LYM7_9BACI|nr:bifunctional adenosylcobinamide kinase/adenosylcobinamide-phosphate guanylyltransferase [Bacillus benzoevorans]MBB6447687.1 adenosyl cobinamide kinase/adenosyl cobinamide phosphate guanylyltransferase [Bacillus benzoevorans]
MHFVTGGAFNGKSAWVKAYYHMEAEAVGNWFSGYRGDALPEDLHSAAGVIVVLEGIEQWVKELLMEHDPKSAQDMWHAALEKWLQWERGQQGRVVCLIGSDITKGIVPASEEERELRDTAGRVFQDTAAVCERVDLIWYGIGQQLK